MDIPAPVGPLLRRARNAKSAKERHDTAYFAWEASVRLAVAARPPADASRLRVPATGAWVAALSLDGASSLDAPPLLAACALFREVGLGARGTPRAISAKALLEHFPAYRNKVMAHGAVRADEFYEPAAAALVAGLEAAWEAGVFWPPAGRLLCLDEARGELAPGAYLDADGRAAPLYPWVLRHKTELREGLLFFNGRRRSAEYLDYESGEPLRGKGLAAAFPPLDADLARLLGAGAAPPPEPEKEDPTLFGDYRILGRLGAGGMGVVHLARQESLGRLVALKMLLPAAAGDDVARRRFEREVAALSRCDHPNVVKILASGRDPGPARTPYYAMELVEGPDLGQVAAALGATDDLDAAVSIAWSRARAAKREAFASAPEISDERAAAAAPPPARRGDRFRRLAALFRDAARGVHHLHEAGVIHRDLKPANLMVTSGDHRLVVMDLGLAAIGDATRVTRDQGALLGTLRYMPPEQLERSGEVDRRADVYALGATLYELAVGRPLVDGDTEARVVEQVLRADPVPPERANPRLPRDLALVIRKATARDRRLRYETAEALAQDLEAFLDGRPIAARAPTLAYVLGLAVRRNRVAATTILAAAAALVAGTGVFLRGLGAARAREAEHRRRAEDLLSFMLGDLSQRLRPIGKIELLDEVATQAKAYYEALSREEDLDPAARRKYADALGNLADVLAAQGRLPDAVATAELVLDLRRLDERRPGDRAVAGAHLRLGELQRAQGRLRDAAASFGAAREIQRRQLAEHPEEVGHERDLGVSTARIAEVLRGQGDLPGALRESEDAIRLLERVAAALPSSTASRFDLAQACDAGGAILSSLGRKEEAFGRFERSLEMRRLLVAADPANVIWQIALARSQTALGSALQERGDVGAALPYLREALETRRRIAALDPANLGYQREAALLQGMIGSLLLETGDADAALASLRASLAAFERLAAIDPTNSRWHHDLAVCHEKTGNALEAVGDIEGAIAEFRAALEMWRRRATRDPSGKAAAEQGLAAVHGLIGDAQALAGRLEEALASYRAQRDALERCAPGQRGGSRWRGNMAVCRAGMAQVLCRLGDLPAAVSECALALEANPEEPEAFAARAAIHERRGEIDAALAEAGRALEGDEGCREACLARGRARAARKEVEGAAADLEAFLERSPHDARAKEVRALLGALRGR